jgi:cyclase
VDLKACQFPSTLDITDSIGFDCTLEEPSDTVSQDWLGCIQEAYANRAGEIFLQSVDRDGTRQALDLKTVRVASKKTKSSLVPLGGAGSMAHICEDLVAGVDAVEVGSVFVLRGSAALS